MLPGQQWGMWAGVVALGLMMPAALTSFDGLMTKLGSAWRRIHLLSLPALLLVAIHTGLVGSSYLGDLQLTSAHWLRVILLGVSIVCVFLARSRFIWSLLSLEKFYVAPSP